MWRVVRRTLTLICFFLIVGCVVQPDDCESMKSETIKYLWSVNMKQVEKLVRAITLINDALEVTKTLGDDIQYPLLDCETAIYKKG